MKKKRKIYVLDTSVVISDPDVFYRLSDVEIVIPTAVVREVDGLKKHPNPDEPRALAARKVARILDKLGATQNITTGALTSSGSTVKICSRYTVIDDLDSDADNRILGTTIKLTEEYNREEIILLTADRNMRTIARAYGILAQHYPFHSQGAVNETKTMKKLSTQRDNNGHKNEPTRSHSHKKSAETQGLVTVVLILISIILYIFSLLLHAR